MNKWLFLPPCKYRFVTFMHLYKKKLLGLLPIWQKWKKSNNHNLPPCCMMAKHCIIWENLIHCNYAKGLPHITITKNKIRIQCYTQEQQKLRAMYLQWLKVRAKHTFSTLLNELLPLPNHILYLIPQYKFVICKKYMGQL